MVIALCSFLVTGCNSKKGIPQQINDTIFISYQFSAEVAYEDIEIKNNKLTYRHLAKDFKCPDNYVAQAPCYSEKDQVTEDFLLTGAETEELIQLVEKSGFLQLNGNYGGAGNSQRFYPYNLSVKLNGRESNVVYHSFPGAQPMPEAFKTIQSRIISLAKSKAIK
jgi:hypothetical protein